MFKEISGHKKSIYKQLLILSTPIVLQQFVTISLNFIDNIMVGTIGIYDIAAVSFANKVFFVFLLTIFGAVGGISIFMAQFYGKKDMVMMRKLFALANIVSLILGGIGCIVSYIFAYEILMIFSEDERVISLGVTYLRIVCFTYPLLALTLSITTTLRSMGNTRLPLMITLVATLVNALFNYFLIYGNFGFPEWGSKGAAVATLLARVVELVCFLGMFAIFGYGLKAKIKDYFGLSKKFLKEVLKVSIPVFCTEFLWVIGTTLISVAYARLGTEVAASVQIGDLVLHFGSIIFLGLAVGTGIMISQNIGAGKKDRVFVIAREVMLVAVGLAIFTVIAGLLVINPILSLYNLEEATKEMARVVLILTSVAMFFKLLNWTIIIGVLRAGGDTIFVFWLDVFVLFAYAVPIAFVGALVWNLNIYTLIILVNIEEILKLGVALYRFRSKRWINDLTLKKQ